MRPSAFVLTPRSRREQTAESGSNQSTREKLSRCRVPGASRLTRTSAAQQAGVFLLRRKSDASHARRIPYRRRHWRIVRAECRGMRRARAWSGPTLRRGSADHRQNVEAQVINCDRGSGLPARLSRRSRSHRTSRGRHQARPIDIDVKELQRRLVLVYTGAPHFSGTNNWEITKRHIDGDRHVFECFERIVAAASGLRDALAREDWPALRTTSSRNGRPGSSWRPV